MFRTCTVAVLAAVVVLMASPAVASWTLIDDFTGYTAGAQIGSLAAWTTSGSNASSHTVAVDPAGSGNLVLAAINASSNIYTSATIAQGNTGTLFFRFHVPTATTDFAVGLTASTTPTAAGDHADSFRVENGALRVYHGSEFTTVASSISTGNWYNVWHVINNQADTWQLYVEGPGFTGQQQLASGSVTDFGFRGGSGPNDLVNFFIRTNGNHAGNTAYIDDVYLFATGADLSFPLHLYWATGASGTGGTGNWSTTDATWSTTDQGVGTKQAWAATGPHKDAVFGGSAGTVTMDAAGVTADNLRFVVDGYTVSGGTLTLAGTAPTVTVASAASATISANIVGDDGLVKAGAGKLTLSGANNYTGGTMVSDGVLAISSTSALPGWNTAGGFTVADGALLAAGNDVSASDFNTMRALTGNFASGARIGLDTSAGNRAFSDAIIGPLPLVKIGSNQLTLSGSGANAYAGATIVSEGTLMLSKAGGAIAVPGDLLIESGAYVRFTASNQIDNDAHVVMTGSGSAMNGTGINANSRSSHQETIGSLTVLGGAFNTGGSSTWKVTGSGSFTGGTGGASAVIHSGSSISFGGLSLDAMTSGTPQTLNSFTIYGNHATLTTVSVGSGGLTLDGSQLLMRKGTDSGRSGSRLILDGDLATTGSSASAIRWEAGTVGVVELQLSSTAAPVTRTFNVAGGGANLSIGVDITNGEASAAGIVKTGAGTLTLSGANTYTGTTTVSGGTLTLSRTSGDAVPGDLVITSGAYVRFTANEQIADTANVFMSGSGSVLNGTGINQNARASHIETIASLTVTGGAFNAGSTNSGAVWNITGAGTFIGGADGASFTGQSASITSFGSLSLTGMNSEVYLTPNSFWIGGGGTEVATTVSVGSGGLALDGSNILMRRGGTSTQLGTRLVLNGDVTTTGASASAIKLTTATPGDHNKGDLELSSSAGNVIRTFNVGGGGADLLIGVPLTNGAADTAGIRKMGAGTLTLDGLTDYTRTSTYTGATIVEQGALVVNGILLGTSGIALHSGATLGGTGMISATVAGAGGSAGLISPGNSAGILTVDSIDPSGGMGFAFELGQLGSPDYTSAAGSINDVLRLTNANHPALAAMDAGNVVDIYLGVATVAMDDVFRGGVYVDAAVDASDRAAFYQAVRGAEYNYFVLGDGGGSHQFGGLSYYTLGEFDSFLKMSLSIEGDSAEFALGQPAILGSVMQFTVVPEPGGWLLLASSLAGLLAVRRRFRG